MGYQIPIAFTGPVLLLAVIGSLHLAQLWGEHTISRMPSARASVPVDTLAPSFGNGDTTRVSVGRPNTRLLARFPDRYAMYDHVASLALSARGKHLGTIAEVGVWRGGNSKRLWDAFHPEKMLLTDLWAETNDPRYKASNQQLVEKLFESQVASGAVQTHKGDSEKWMASLADGALDLMYLDTVHSYGRTRLEMDRVSRVISKRGYLCGHDFGHPDEKGGMVYGVIEAVMDFALTDGWELIAVSLDKPYRSFCMERLQ